MKYKILITDFDDTLLDDNFQVSKENRNAIDKFIKKGGIFAINTGRMTCFILPYAKEFALKGLVGCYQGGVVYNLSNNTIERDSRMNVNQTVSQLELLERYGQEVHLYDGDNLYVENRFDYSDMYEKTSDVKVTVTNEKLSGFAKRNNISANKLMLISSADKVSDIRNILDKEKHDDITYVLSKPIFLEVLHVDGQKGSFVKFMSDKYNVPLEDIICVGDSLNDSDMIKVAGLGIAVANAHEDLKKISDLVLDKTNNEHAICYIIENIILKGER